MDSKVCSDCGQEKALSEFDRSTREKTGVQSKCKICARKYAKTQQQGKKVKAILYKGGVCEGCGGAFSPEVYDFHHRDPTEKEAHWGQLRSWSWNRIVLEIDKCALLCANCHRMEHANYE